jgi:hypothetical protein
MATRSCRWPPIFGPITQSVARGGTQNDLSFGLCGYAFALVFQEFVNERPFQNSGLLGAKNRITQKPRLGFVAAAQNRRGSSQ